MYSILFNNLPCFFFFKKIILNLYHYNKFNNIYFEEREREREQKWFLFFGSLITKYPLLLTMGLTTTMDNNIWLWAKSSKTQNPPLGKITPRQLRK